MQNQIDTSLEEELLRSGHRLVIGVDEVGRGSWAGPIIVAAFVFESTSRIIPGVNDSKKLSPVKRNSLSPDLSIGRYSIGSVSVEEIESLNVIGATRVAIGRAIKSLAVTDFFALVDGYFKDTFDFKHECIIRGDEKHYSIAAASILAKVYRDNLMKEMAKKYVHYGFDRNMGYGTKEHQMSIRKYGICEIHRKNYRPIRDYLRLLNPSNN